MASQTTGYIVIAVLSLLWIGIGLYFARGDRVTSFDDYAVSGRSVGFGLGIGTLLASWITANTVLAAPQIAYQLGFLGIFGYMAAGGLGLLLFVPIAHRVKRILPLGYTVSDFIIERYDRKNYYLFLVFFFTLILMNGAQLPIGAGTILQVTFGIDYQIAILITVLPILFYIVIGGMRSVVATDYLQSLAILFLLIVFVPAILTTMSPAEIVSGMKQANPQTVALDNSVGLLWVVAGALIGWGQVTMYNFFWQRIFTLREESMTKAFAVTGLSWMVVPLLTGFFGLITLARDIQVENINQVAPLAIMDLLPGMGAITFVVILYAAFSSTLDTRVNSMAVMMARELYHKHFNPDASDDQVLRSAKYATLLYGVIVIAIAWGQPPMIDILVVLGTINAAYIAPVALGAFWEDASPDAAFLGTLVACLFGVYATLGPFFGLWQSPKLPIHNQYMAIVICFVTSLVIVVVGSLLRPDTFTFSQMSDTTDVRGGVQDD